MPRRLARGDRKMKKAPTQWTNGIWDIGSRENMGKDSIPTLYDASVSGYTVTEYAPGVGYGNELYVSEIVETTPGDPWIAPVPAARTWAPVVECGYFYMGKDEYYLFVNKETVVATPTVGRVSLGRHSDKAPTLGAPIIVTLDASEFAADEPFGKTFEYTPSGCVPERTTNKYRKRVDLTPIKEYMSDASGYLIHYNYTLGETNPEKKEFVFSATGVTDDDPTRWDWYIDCYPSGGSVTVEYESAPSGYYEVKAVDVNPYASSEVYNTFVTIVDETELEEFTIDVSSVSRYLPVPGNKLKIVACAKDRNGVPVSGAAVGFTSDGGGLFSDGGSLYTEWDGTCTVVWTVPNTDYGCIITATANGAIGSGWIPIGE